VTTTPATTAGTLSVGRAGLLAVAARMMAMTVAAVVAVGAIEPVAIAVPVAVIEHPAAAEHV
jgi:hypothetical protein